MFKTSSFSVCFWYSVLIIRSNVVHALILFVFMNIRRTMSGLLSRALHARTAMAGHMLWLLWAWEQSSIEQTASSIVCVVADGSVVKLFAIGNEQIFRSYFINLQDLKFCSVSESVQSAVIVIPRQMFAFESML